MGRIFVITLLCISPLLYSYSLAQWTEPVEIDGEFHLGAPRAVAVGETLHVVAVNPPRAWYLRSEDNGATWSEPIIPIDTSREIERPDLRYSKGNLHLIWREFTDPLYPQLYYARSSDGGRSWRQPVRVFANSTSRVLPFVSLATNGDTLFTVCDVSFDSYKRYLFFRSLDAGETWQDSIVIEQGPLIIIQPHRLLYASNRLHFIHPMSVDVDSFGYEIYYRNSDDFGITWSDRIILSPAELHPHTIASQIPSACADSTGRIVITWMDYANGSMCGISGDIFYRVSLDNGDSWQPYGNITDTQSGWNSYGLILGDKFHVVWDDFWLHGCSFSKEAYSFSTDLGQNWESPDFISGTDIILETNPALVYTIGPIDTVLHCFFSREIEGSHLFYIRSSSLVSVDNEYIELEKEINLNAYPNPFNSQTSFSFSMLNEDGCLEIFNMQGQLVKRIMLKENRGYVTWDSRNMKGDGVSSGVYYATLKSGEFKKTIQITLLR